ncbi:MAG: hypothetical protein RBU37_20780, partial [Myxococcota bacterium]|nr:hypothetical protein [Myxococcota bacterium]
MSKLQQETAYERVEREDLVLFVNACFACTSQREFYGSSAAQSVSIAFLHDYILGNYRQLYVRMLAVGVNHFNQSQIILRLLAAGAPAEPHQRREESALLTAALHALPASAVFRLFSELARRRVNNRRSRALIAAYLRARPDPNFDAVKYRAKLSTAARHAHLRLGDERGTFLFALRSVRAFETPLFEQFRQAHYSGTAIFDLPFTVAEGLAAKKGLDQGAFLERIAPKMSAAEKLRMQTSAARHGAKLELDLRRAPLTRLAV